MIRRKHGYIYRRNSLLSLYQRCYTPHLKQGHNVAHQEGAEEDEGDKVNIGQIGATALILILS
jgi:hypothetical protein